MTFHSRYPVKPWEENVLLSPETELTTDTLLTFKLGKQRSGSLDIYATSHVEHYSARLAHFSPSVAVTQNETIPDEFMNEMNASSGSQAFTNISVCVPRDSYQIAFVASAMNRVIETQPDVVIKDVVLTDTPCSAATSPGNKISNFSKTTRQFFAYTL